MPSAELAAGPVTPLAPRGRRNPHRRRPSSGRSLGLGLTVGYLSLVVLIPLGAVVWQSQSGGWSAFWSSLTSPQAWAALRLTVLAALAVAAVNLVMGTVIAWLLVRDRCPGSGLIDVLIDLPFALPTVVAGLVLLTLYGPHSPIGLNIAYTRAGVVAALLFVTLPFVVRTVAPVLAELDPAMEEAAASLGAGRLTILRRVVLPNLAPAMISGAALAFARAVSEFGSTVLISGNLPFKTEVAAVYLFNQIEADNAAGAAAVSTALLVVALVVMAALELVRRWSTRRG